MTADDDLDPLLDHLSDPRDWTWIVDFDGTLAPIVDHPDDAALAPGAREALAELATWCEVAVLSGRALDDLIVRLGQVPPRLLLVGGHGAQARLPDGQRFALTDLAAARDALDEVVADLTTMIGGEEGWLVERKPTSVAVHHRRVPAAALEPTLGRVTACLTDATDLAPGFALLTGKAVLELKVAAVDKGRAVDWIIGAAATADTPRDRRPLVLGDDVTDEDAFAAANAAGGAAVLVSDEPAATAARFRLHDPERVVTLLRAAIDRLGQATPSKGPVWDVRP